MTACGTCGTAYAVGAKFCAECGTPQLAACPSCGATTSLGAKFCPHCGSGLHVGGPGRPALAVPVASRRITSVLFGDLVGFTTLSESRDQEEVRELLSRYFEECSRIVARYGGTVEKFIGDAVMAVWGVPTSHEDDAERSVRAGLELVAATAAMGNELGVSDLAMRVGIVTGEVAVTVGALQQGMVAGDAVNTASRVQSVAAPGQVWVDETTRLLTSAAISYADVGSHALKGKADPVPLWSARAVVAQIGGTARADGLEAPLVGRDRELRMVKEAYHRVEETNRPSLLLVVGDAGVGKSRLGWEFSKYTDGLSTTCRWHAGKCVSYGEGVAYYALAEAVRSRLETTVGPGAAPSDTPELIDTALAALIGSQDERSWLAPRLGALLGAAGSSSFQREELFAAWTTFFERVAVGGEPVVMMIDDAQYADDGLVKFVEHVMAVASFPFLVMLLARPELSDAHPGLVTNRRATVLNLEQLTAADMAQLVDGLVEGLPAGVRDALVERAEGVPTYAVETVRALIDRDLVVPRGGTYVLRDPAALDLAAIGAPASLQALVSARLDTLSPAERRVVDLASVAGDSVEPGLLAELCADVPEFHQVVSSLVRAQILRVEASPLSSEAGRYQFVQSVVRQVAYGTLSRRGRKQAHLQVLEALTREGSEELAPVAAQHCIAATEAVPDDDDVPDLTDRAVGLLRQAGERAISLGSPTESLGHLAKALALTDEPRSRAELQLAMARACEAASRYDEGIELAGAAVEGFAGLGDPDQEALSAAALSTLICRGPADYQRAVDLIEPWYRSLRDGPVTDTYARVFDAYSLPLGRLGRGTFDLAVEQLTIAERLGDESGIARGYMSLVLIANTSGSLQLAAMLVEKSAQVAHACHDLVAEGRALANWTSFLSTEDTAHATEVGTEALQICTRCGIAEFMSYSLVNLSRTWWAIGEWDRVLEARQSETIHPDDEATFAFLAREVLAARGHDPADIPVGQARPGYGGHWVSLAQGLAASYAGDGAAAGKAASNALTSLGEEELGTQEELPDVFGAAVDVAVRFNDRALLDQLRQVAAPSARGLTVASLRGHRALLAALDPANETLTQDVEQWFRAALKEYDVWGSPVHLARTRAAYGVWLTRQGRRDEASSELVSARETFERLGAVAWLRDLEARLTESTLV
jgi:class 3 adenylate cyclase